jgi:hypothetical protein
VEIGEDAGTGNERRGKKVNPSDAGYGQVEPDGKIEVDVLSKKNGTERGEKKQAAQAGSLWR